MSACKDEPSQPPAGSEPSTPTKAETPSDVAAPVDSDKPRADGGLAGLTREIVEDARSAAQDPLRLIPNDAEFLFVAHPGPVAAFEPATGLLARAESDADLGKSLESFRACVGELKTMKRVALAMDRDDHIWLALEATDLGVPKTWDCVREQVIARGDEWDLKLTGTEPGKGPQLIADDGDLGYFIGRDTLVLASAAWGPAVEDRLRNEGVGAIDGQLASVMTLVDQSAPMWGAGILEAELSAQVHALLGAELVNFATAVTLDEDTMNLSFSSLTETDGMARSRSEALQSKVTEMSSMFSIFGLSGSLAPKFDIKAEGKLVTMELPLSAEQIKTLRTTIEAGL